MLLAAESVNFPLLSALVILPALGAAVVALIPSRRAEAARTVGLLFSLGTLALVAYLVIKQGSALKESVGCHYNADYPNKEKEV